MGLFSGIGKLLGAGKGEKYNREYLQKALDEYGDLRIPTVDELGGTPISSSFSEEDPALRNRQMQIINDLYGVYEREGLDDRAKARLDETRRLEDIRTRGAREAIQQNARSRGVGSSDIIDQLINAQMSSDRKTGQDTQILGDLEQRKMDALTGAGNMATTTRGQDFNKMTALDAIRKFNQQNKSNAYQTKFSNQYNIANKKAGIYGDMGGSRQTQQDLERSEGIGTLAGVAGWNPVKKAGKKIADKVTGWLF